MHGLKKIIIVGGTTCSGKTETSVGLSNFFPIEIINFDSMCFYRYFDIGTAKPDNISMGGIRHHLIDIKNPDEAYNAGMFSEDAARLVEDITGRGKIPVFTGGTGLYARSLLYGLSPVPEFDKIAYRKKIDDLIAEIGLTNVYGKLKEIDPDYAGKISGSDRQRITRAYEVFEATGKPLSYYLRSKPFGEPLYDFLYFNLIPSKEDLKSCIIKRTACMLEKGLTEEIKGILNKGYHSGLKPFGSIGYKEGLLYLNGALETMDDLFSAIISSTAKYAKRQATFFRKEINVIGVSHSNLNERLIFMKNIIEDFLG